MDEATCSWGIVIDAATVMVISIAIVNIHKIIINIRGIWHKLYGISVIIVVDVVVSFCEILKIREKMRLITTMQ